MTWHRVGTRSQWRNLTGRKYRRWVKFANKHRRAHHGRNWQPYDAWKAFSGAPE